MRAPCSRWASASSRAWRRIWRGWRLTRIKNAPVPQIGTGAFFLGSASGRVRASRLSEEAARRVVRRCCGRFLSGIPRHCAKVRNSRRVCEKTGRWSHQKRRSNLGGKSVFSEGGLEFLTLARLLPERAPAVKAGLRFFRGGVLRIGCRPARRAGAGRPTMPGRAPRHRARTSRRCRRSGSDRRAPVGD